VSPIAAWWTLSRPKLLPFVLGLVVLGWAWAHWDRAMTLRNAPALGYALVAWAWLHAGTLWLNAALDRDEGEVLLGEAVAPPPGTEAAGYAGLLVCLGFAWMAGPIVTACAAACCVLAVAYSHPSLVWKGHPLGGPLVNVVGYGLLSPMAGFAVADVPPDARTLAMWPLAAVGILGTYFTAQAFQAEEDGRRGYRTLAATHGPAVVLAAVRVCFAVALLGGLVLSVIGWLPRTLLVGVVAWVPTDRYLARWAAEPGGGNEAWARSFARRLGATLLLAIGLAFVDYVVDSWNGAPVAGLGTAAGHPHDRPRLPPAEMRRWERLHPDGAAVRAP
jgi:4-hydroxybenzoate polyprenyltransferase